MIYNSIGYLLKTKNQAKKKWLWFIKIYSDKLIRINSPFYTAVNSSERHRRHLIGSDVNANSSNIHSDRRRKPNGETVLNNNNSNNTKESTKERKTDRKKGKSDGNKATQRPYWLEFSLVKWSRNSWRGTLERNWYVNWKNANNINEQ